MVRIVDLADGTSSATPPTVGSTIAQVKVAVANNTTAAITGLSLDSGEVIQGMIVYHVYRDNDSIARIDQSGSYNAYWNGSTWLLSENHVDGADAGFQLSINGSGQVSYTTTNIPGANPVGFVNARIETLGVI